MKLIIAGSRTITDYAFLLRALDLSGFKPTEIVSGGCKGPDLLGERYAEENGLKIKRFLADWQAHGKAAGPIRNSQMATYADALIALWDGQSAGTADMIRKAKKRNLKVFVLQP